MISNGTGVVRLVALTVLIAIAAGFAQCFSQPHSDHQSAGAWTWIGMTGSENVISNLPFAIFGAWGLWFLATRSSAKSFIDSRERIPSIIFLIGVLLTASGSGCYHFMADNNRLVWDRLPMTIAFLSLVFALIAERFDVAAGVRVFVPLIGSGGLTVVYWRFTAQRGVGDLRFYEAVRSYAILVLLLMLLAPARYARTGDPVWVGIFYPLAKILEAADSLIYALQHDVSGHTLKHLPAGMSGYFVLHMLRKRTPIFKLAGELHAV